MPMTIVRPQDRRLEASRVDGNVPAAVAQQSKMQVVSPENPYVHMVEVAGGTHVPMHSHSSPEVMVVLSGSVRVNETLCEAGSLVVIPAHEEYELVAGDGSLVFLVVRPAHGSFQTPSE